MYHAFLNANGSIGAVREPETHNETVRIKRQDTCLELPAPTDLLAHSTGEVRIDGQVYAYQWFHHADSQSLRLYFRQGDEVILACLVLSGANRSAEMPVLLAFDKLVQTNCRRFQLTAKKDVFHLPHRPLVASIFNSELTLDPAIMEELMSLSLSAVGRFLASQENAASPRPPRADDCCRRFGR